MNPAVGIAILLAVLQAARGQKVHSLTACLEGLNMRLDCRFENSTKDPLKFEISLTRENQKHVLQGDLGIPEHAYRSRLNLSTTQNHLALYMTSFTSKDEGIYNCQFQVPGEVTHNPGKNLTVYKDKLARCAGISLLIQNTSWLLLLLLSLPLLQAVDFVSL
ncbi:thy-1 membrane glycoprotein [Tachyglossus aculeatus]|uniref:thy-1 membrane glycoprotein n=1 Tax=Tachyglossus aculeatus TaxID=9261 RepID=UPI0018F32E17|nr:thy-1 membrane glycoprotein [Tachyglossus aculeatus]